MIKELIAIAKLHGFGLEAKKGGKYAIIHPEYGEMKPLFDTWLQGWYFACLEIAMHITPKTAKAGVFLADLLTEHKKNPELGTKYPVGFNTLEEISSKYGYKVKAETAPNWGVDVFHVVRPNDYILYQDLATEYDAWEKACLDIKQRLLDEPESPFAKRVSNDDALWFTQYEPQKSEKPIKASKMTVYRHAPYEVKPGNSRKIDTFTGVNTYKIQDGFLVINSATGIDMIPVELIARVTVHE